MAKRVNRSQVAFVTIILSCLAYFGGGAIAMRLGWLPKESYLALAGIVGGLASVIGLISLLRPAISATDLQNLEVQSLRSLTERTQDLKKLEAEREKTAAQIGTLELQKREMEILVRKASLDLFLREQRDHHAKRIRAILTGNQELAEHVQQLIGVDEKLKALDVEIEHDPNVDVLKEVMASSQLVRKSALDDAIARTQSPALKASLVAFKSLAEMALRLVKVYE